MALLVDVERLPEDLQAQLAPHAMPISASDARHLAALLDREEETTRLACFDDIAERAEMRDAKRARMLRAISGEEPLPAIGAFPREMSSAAPNPDRWLREDPRRLASVVKEMARFTDNLRHIAETTLDLADRLGINEQLADRILCSAIRDLRGDHDDAS